jgi:DNA-binding NarL/FixJ family response regulator
VPRVLLADDDPAFLRQLEELLSARLPELEIVASVADGHEAVAAAMAYAPAIVVIDYAMPGPSGGHAAAVIQQALPEATVIVVTGLGRDEAVEIPPHMRLVQKGAGIERDLFAALASQP